MSLIGRLLMQPTPSPRRAIGLLAARLNWLSRAERLELDLDARPEYGWPMLRQAYVAKRLGLTGYTAIELGVAGGNGLLAMEAHARHIADATGVQIDVLGFDTGAGLPAPSGHLDHPYAWSGGDFAMDVARLQAKFTTARLVLGDVSDTVAPAIGDLPLPVGFIAFDLDLHSATANALRLFDAPLERFMPRVTCYFDDVLAGPELAYTHFAGELRAIADFNAAHADIKIDRGLGVQRARPASWLRKLYVAHLFHHPLYAARAVPSADLALR